MRKINFAICLVVVLLSPAAKAQNRPVNIIISPLVNPIPASNYLQIPSPVYERTFMPNKPFSDTSSIKMTSPAEQVSIATVYSDQLGRPIQAVSRQSSPLQKDVVQPFSYDEFGNNSFGYLPYTASTVDGSIKSQPLSADSAFYNSNFPSQRIYYTQTGFDASPINRVTKQYAPGNEWSGSYNGILNYIRTNSAGDSVRLWTIGTSAEDDVPVTTKIYDPGTLNVSTISDESNKITITFTDQFGRVVLTKSQQTTLLFNSDGHLNFLCTYYVYDEIGNLRFVIPPKAVEAINKAGVNWNISSEINTALCYAYWFDARGRITMKRIPGKGKMYIAFDLFDRVVMTQDANLRNESKWTFVKYDGQGRPVKSGLISSTLNKDSIINQAARSSDYPSLTGTFTVTSEIAYDEYNLSGNPLDGNLVTTNINSTNFYTSYTTSPYPEAIVSSKRIRGSVTATKKLVLGTTATYLYTTMVYDEKGRNIQTKQTNYTGGTDVITMQYSFSGRLLRSHLSHEKSGNTVQNHTLLTKFVYDHAGRLLSITKNIDSKGDKTTIQNTYNELDKLSKKTFGNNVEIQNFTYNIRGWLDGINKDFVKTNNSTNFFGEEICYNSGFTSNQLNGNIAGVKWRSKGDGTARAYGFTYDRNNRLVTADFSQQNAGSTNWTNDKMDFTVSGLTHDANGNIMTVKRKGVVINSIETIDDLTYQYRGTGGISNQLQKVTDAIISTAPLGDFKDTAFAGDDYVYDVNGNILKDMNKHIHEGAANGILYNVLDKPTKITVNGKGTVEYTYDASGALLQKTVTDNKTAMKKVITYVAGFVYEKSLPKTGNAASVPDTLQYVLHEEGRIRWSITQTGSSFVYDYFLKDHLGNIRSVITEEARTDGYLFASLEDAPLANEKNYYTNLDIGRKNKTTVPGYPTNDATTTPNNYIQELNGNSAKVGAGMFIKVMAGDKLNISTSYWYPATFTSAPNVSPLTDLVTAIASGVSGESGGKLLESQLNTTVLSPSITGFLNNRDAGNNITKPKAYLNVVLLDEQLQPVLTTDGKNSFFQQVSVAGGTSVNQIVIANREMAKNGYVYIYVSNESKDFKVYFDNLKVTHVRDPLLSEEGYYPFGMTMSAISSTAGTVAKNNYKFNAGTELTENFDINYYETYFRQYDVQLGRFTGVDALAEQTLSWSPYQFGYNNPALFNDPTGLFADYTPETVKTSRRNSRLNNGYIDILTGHPETADAEFFLSEGYDYNLGAGAFNINFARMATNARGERGFWLPFIGPSQPGRNGDLPGVVVGSRFLKYEMNGRNYTLWEITSSASGAASVGGSVKNELIEYGIRDRAGITRRGFSQLSNYSKAVTRVRAVGATGAKYLRYSKNIGVVGNVIGAVSAVYQVSENPTAGNATRLAVQGVAIGAAFIPVVGWGISLSIGVADLIWGDKFYNWIDSR